MIKKNFWDEVLNRGKWLIIFLVGLLFSQFPLALATFLTSRKFPLLQTGLLVGALSLVVLTVFIIGARKTQLARLALSYLVILAFNILGVVLLRLMNETTTSNQSNINDLVQNSSLISSFFLLVLIAPICEEILCRGVIPKKLFRGKENVGYIVGAIIFALLHLPTNLPSLLIYGGMSTVLTWTVYKTQRLEMSILLHMIVNGVAFCLLALVVIMSRTLGISV
ncbi:TPA: lysostaphin resistance A-like protein [Streptococcus pneumoniae]